jgi:PAS domain S-box-containing protein
MCLRILISFLFIIIRAQVYASESVIIDSPVSFINITNRLDYIEDKTGSLTIDNVSGKNLPWKTNDRNYVNFGYNLNPHWFKLSVNNKGTERRDLLFEIDYPALDYVEFYRKDISLKWNRIKSGDGLPFSERDISVRDFVYDIKLLPGENTFFFRIETSRSLRFYANVLSSHEHIERLNNEHTLGCIIFGMLIVLALYNLCISLSTREITYLYLFLFIVSILLNRFELKGFASQYLWPETTWWKIHSYPVFLALSVAGGIIFVTSSLKLNRIYPYINRIIIISGLVQALLASALSVFYRVDIALRFSVYFLMAASPFIFGIIIFLSIKKIRIAWFLLTGLVLILIIAPLAFLSTTGIMPSVYFLSEWIIDFAFVWFALFSSLGLADRINNLKNELERSEKIIQGKNIELLSSNEEMEAVNENLIEANEKLVELNEELINAQENIARSETNFRTLSDFNNAAVCLISNGKYIYVNGALMNALGYTLEEILGMNGLEIVHPDYRDLVMQMAAARRSGEKSPSVYDMLVLTKSGESKWFNVSVAEIDYQGKRAILVTGIDITQRKAIEISLAESEEKYRAMFENMGSGVAVFSAVNDGRDFI